MTKRPERIFLKPTQISRHLSCSICSEVFYEPMRLFCGHTFCQSCITEWATKNKTCPICRKDVELGLMGKDLISEKIIMDLEVRCTNRLCDWKDRLENLPKHLKNCAFAKTPNWLNEAQNFANLNENKTDGDMPFLVQHDEHFIERVNEEVSRKSLLERLYTKNEESKELVDTVFNKSNSKSAEKSKEKSKGKGKGKGRGSKKGKKNEVTKGKSFEDYQDFLGLLDDSDEETKEEQENPGSSEGSSKISSLTSKQGEVKDKPEVNGDSLNSILVKNSQNTNKTEMVDESQDLLDQDEPEEPTIGITTRLRSGRAKGKTQKNSGEPKLIKKAKTVS